jgi:hypothetical protein
VIRSQEYKNDPNKRKNVNFLNCWMLSLGGLEAVLGAWKAVLEV